jgi:hypothetical protein
VKRVPAAEQSHVEGGVVENGSHFFGRPYR